MGQELNKCGVGSAYSSFNYNPNLLHHQPLLTFIAFWVWWSQWRVTAEENFNQYLRLLSVVLTAL